MHFFHNQPNKRSTKSHRQAASLFLLLALSAGLSFSALSVTAHAAEYKSRLSQLMIRANELYLPSRLVIGTEAVFTVKAPVGYMVQVFLSPSDSGYRLKNGLSLQVGEQHELLSGTVPESGVLQLKMAIPDDPELDGKSLFVDAAVGRDEHSMETATLIQSNGHKAEQNQLAIVTPAKKNGPAVLPSMPGVSPQLFNQITNVVDAYAKGDEEVKKTLDTGEINRDRPADQNPFVNRGLTPGLQGGSR